MTSPADDNLRYLSAAASRYAAPEDMTAYAAQAIERMDPERRARSEVEALLDAVLVLADAHAGPHDSCNTCSALRNGLSVALGIVRAETDLALRGMYDV